MGQIIYVQGLQWIIHVAKIYNNQVLMEDFDAKKVETCIICKEIRSFRSKQIRILTVASTNQSF